MNYPFQTPFIPSLLARPALLFILGSTIGGLGWWQGDSRWPALAFQLLSGFGYPVLFIILALLLLSVMAFKGKGRPALFAYNDFYNIWPYVQATLIRIIAVFAGMIMVAGVCWSRTGSVSAMLAVLYGTVLLAVAVFYLVGMSSIAAGLAQRGQPVDPAGK